MRQDFFSVGGHTNKLAVLFFSPSHLANTFRQSRKTTKAGLISLALFLPSSLGGWYVLQNNSFNSVGLDEANLGAEEAVKVNTTSQATEIAPIEQPKQNSEAANSSNSASNSTSSQTTVNVNGQSVTSSTSPSNPNESINKTINTNNGSTHISIQNQTQSTSRSTRSSQNVHVRSFSSGDSSSSTSIYQFTSGGNR